MLRHKDSSSIIITTYLVVALAIELALILVGILVLKVTKLEGLEQAIAGLAGMFMLQGILIGVMVFRVRCERCNHRMLIASPELEASGGRATSLFRVLMSGVFKCPYCGASYDLRN